MTDAELLRAAFAFAPIGAALIAPAGDILEANPAFCAVVGYTRDELRSLAVDDLVVPDDLAPGRAAARQLLAGEAADVQLEQRLVRRDGRLVHARVTFGLAPASDGAAAFLVCQIQDVTPYKAAGAALRASEARLRLALEVAGMACWDWEAATGQTVRSPGLPDLFGLLPEDVSAPRARYLALVHPSDRAALRTAERALIDGGDGYQVEYRVVRSDGQVRWLRDRGEAVRGADGRLLRGVGITQDITDQKQAEAALRESETRFRALVEQLPAAVYTHPLTVGGGLSYISPRIEDLLGYTPDEVMARPGLFQEDVHPEDRAAVAAADARSATTGDTFDARYRVRHADGRWVWLRDRAVLVRGEHGHPLHWQGLLADVTDEVRAEALLREAKEAAEAASRAKDAVLRVVSHDLRTPLTAVTGYAELLQLDGPLTPEQATDIDQILRSAAQLTSLVDGVLDLARARAGKLRLNPREVDLAALIEETRATLAPQAAAKGIGLFVSAPPGLSVRADPLRLRQVLMNLAGNAVKFAERGWVTISARTAPGAVAVDVVDTGPGIAADDVPTIFDEFRQVTPSGVSAHGGAGLGLAIAKALVEAHGGSLRVHSVLGDGATFSVWLPSSENAHVDEPAAEAVPAGAASD